MSIYFRNMNDEQTEWEEPDLDQDLETDEDEDGDIPGTGEGEDEGPRFEELDAILAEATKENAADRKLRAARKRLSHVLKHDHPTRQAEADELVKQIRDLEENRVWITLGNVALFHTQECETCHAKHSYFIGWMREQKHASDPNARRFVAGKGVGLSERREDHTQHCELCSNCVECVIAINAATKGDSEL